MVAFKNGEIQPYMTIGERLELLERIVAIMADLDDDMARSVASANIRTDNRWAKKRASLPGSRYARMFAIEDALVAMAEMEKGAPDLARLLAEGNGKHKYLTPCRFSEIDALQKAYPDIKLKIARRAPGG